MKERIEIEREKNGIPARNKEKREINKKEKRVKKER